MALAKAGQLSQSAVLRSETERLLKDPRSDEFIRSFAHQWLDMKRLDMFEFSPNYHPKFDEVVRGSARQEVYQTIRHILDRDLALENLLKSDFVMVNDVLADYYQLKDSSGSGFYRVALNGASPRGGLLGTAAVHIMGSDGQRSSPVERGSWVLRHLLNDPPPPAPANVPQIEYEEKVAGIREVQGLHQSEPQCAQCHQKIDPIGYGLENFNAAGLWREKEEVEVVDVKMSRRMKRKHDPKFKHFAIDPSGTLPGGQGFNNYFELRDQVFKHYQDSFSRGFAEHLLAYGLGRPYAISDYNAVTAMLNKAEKEGETISSYIHALIQSKSFQVK